MTKAMEAAREIVSAAEDYTSSDPDAKRVAGVERLIKALDDLARYAIEKPSDITNTQVQSLARALLERDAPMREALEEAGRRLTQAAAVLENLGHHAAAVGFLSDAKEARAALSQKEERKT